MPVYIMVGLVALLVALVSYSIACWGAFRSKTLTSRHVTFLWVGLVFDILATAMMAIAAGGLDLSPLADLLHTIIALGALLGMLVVAVLGMRALSSPHAGSRASLARWLLVPWSIWVLVFVWGMVARGSARMGG